MIKEVTPVTLDDHIESIRKTLHELEKAKKADSLTATSVLSALQQLATNAKRDFPGDAQGAGTGAKITEASMGALLTDYLERVNARKENTSTTGLAGLNKALSGGFTGQRLIVLLGTPGSGKTSFANQLAEHVACERPILYVTSEDTPDILIAKTLARIGKLPYGAVLNGWQSHQHAIQLAIQDLGQRPSSTNLHYIDATACPITVDDIRERARIHFAGKPGPGLVVVDYLQRLARAVGSNRELREAVTMLTEQLRALASELDCTVLAIASMNRASYGSGRNQDTNILASAKESGDIEYTADVIMGLVDDTSNRATSPGLKPRILRIDKNRLGETTTIDLDWYAERQQFTEAPGR